MYRRTVFAVTRLMHAPPSSGKLPIDDFSMWTAPAFWMSMPKRGNGAAPGTPVTSSPRSVMSSVSPALMTMPVVGGGGGPMPPVTLMPP